MFLREINGGHAQYMISKINQKIMELKELNIELD
jgi:hypothetical protein